MTTLEGMRVPVKYHHHEVGGPGQCEIETPLMGLLAAADAVQTIKYVSKMVARQCGQAVTFMPKPLFGEAGNGMHFHQHIFKRGVNQFYDAQGVQPAQRNRAPLHRRFAAPCACAAGADQSIHELVPAAGAGLRGAGRTASSRPATDLRRSACRSMPPSRMPSAWSSGLPTRRATRTWPWPRCSWRGSTACSARSIRPSTVSAPLTRTSSHWSPERRAEIKALPMSLGQACEALQIGSRLPAGRRRVRRRDDSGLDQGQAEEHYAVLERPHPYEMQLYFDFSISRAVGPVGEGRVVSRHELTITNLNEKTRTRI